MRIDCMLLVAICPRGVSLIFHSPQPLVRSKVKHGSARGRLLCCVCCVAHSTWKSHDPGILKREETNQLLYVLALWLGSSRESFFLAFRVIATGQEVSSDMPRIRVLPTKRRAEGDAKVVQQLEVMPLGAGREVGRSCILLKYAGKTVLVSEICMQRFCLTDSPLVQLDCGLTPALQGEQSLPFLREIDPADIDIVIIRYGACCVSVQWWPTTLLIPQPFSY